MPWECKWTETWLNLLGTRFTSETTPMAGQMLTTSLVGTLYLSALVNANPCRFIPGDDGWPGMDDWNELNKTVNGRLTVTVPQASVCHQHPYFNYDETACESLQSAWDSAQTLYVPTVHMCTLS